MFILLASVQQLRRLVRARRTIVARRESVGRAGGRTRDPQHVLHATIEDGCGCASCPSFVHLRLGTNYENVQDRVEDIAFAQGVMGEQQAAYPGR